MRRGVVVCVGVALALQLPACGGASLTVVSSPAAFLVITADSDAIVGLKPRIQQEVASLGAPGEHLVDGDHHAGNHVCGFSAAKGGQTYQVDVYGDAPAEACDTARQQSFTNNLP